MAIYHLRVKYLKRSEGRSAVAAAAYRSGTRLEDVRGGVTHDYTRKQNVEYQDVLLPEGAPASLTDRGVLWNTIETGITHPRAQPAMECEAALPRELSKDDCVKLVRGFAHDMWVTRGVAVDLAIHRTTAGDGGEHPHVHFLISTRRFEPSGKLGKAARDMQDNPQLVAKVYALEKEGKLDEALMLEKDLNLGTWRAAWAEYTNRFLTDAGSKSRIDHRTLAAQGIAREPMPYLGMAYNHLRSLTDGLRQRVEEFGARAYRNGLRGQLQTIQRRRPHLMAEFIALARDYGQKLFPELQASPEKGVAHDR
jgi:MobA/MobL family